MNPLRGDEPALGRGVRDGARERVRAARQRASFSIAAVFEADLARILGNELAIGVSDAGKAASAIMNIDGVNWMHHAARRAEQGEAIDLYATAHRSKDCWQAFLHLGMKDTTRQFREGGGFAPRSRWSDVLHYLRKMQSDVSGHVPGKRGKK